MVKVAEQYFSILRDYFGDLTGWTAKRGYSELESVRAVAELYDPSQMKITMESLHQELLNLNWNAQENTIAGMGGVRTAYMGQSYIYKRESPATFDFLKKTGLYSDTIIVNDPILSESLTWQKRGAGEVTSFHLVAQWALRLLAIEDLFSSDLDPPICVLAPSYVISIEKGGRIDLVDNFIHDNIVPLLASDVFGCDFASPGELVDFLSQMKNFKEFTSSVQKPELLVDLDGKPVSESDFQSMREYYHSKYSVRFSLAESLWLFIRRHLTMMVYDLIVNGKTAHNFATDFKGVWNAFLWLTKNDNELIFEHLEKKPISKDMLIMNVLQEDEFRWLGNIPLDKIKKLREEGELQEIRDVLGQNIGNIQNVRDEEFVEVVRQVRYNLEEAFKRHNSEVKALDEKYRRRYDIDVGSLTVSGSLAVVSALLPPLALSTSVASAILGGGSMMQLVKDYINKREQLEGLNKKPIAMLFDAYKSEA